MRHALIRDAQIVELISADGLPPFADRYHPDLVACIQEVPADAGPGWTLRDGVWGPPSATVPSVETAASLARAERDRLISASTWIIERHQEEVLAGRTPTLSAQQLGDWLTYRQALRDLPAQPEFPGTVIWPEAPA